MVIDIREKENEENYSDPEGFVDDLSDSGKDMVLI